MGGQNWTPITPSEGSIFHAETQAKVDESLQAEAEAILRKSNWVDPDQRRAAYAEEGWTRFDDSLDPYGPAEVEQERLRYRR